ncbi:phosphoenolpyruvate--protein phosphotransferase [Aestuariirhabdus sp. Z084]|uniref:phosphoenolpyruvate--protein phosphotransferase n=1 Tax=Aestuariirhabdus haliotis TaxID=2918751 RepID=UPI00201B3877|nr:phosphoenolpyruvate--protein phosphotransferase [Aestuariirhabdus haliotis]MCL6416870.1 phosphoenolpyruvate--protein phosphotransferase [Aestuariirhabdus haliotis]MCL6420854.1 phosphoenolpyruvate--protein phosphotransferase [Aestuariirhabdus haliotis]
MKDVILELARIAQAVSGNEDPRQQAVTIVELISESMMVDVCSLYMAEEDGDMLLLASHGLSSSAVGRTRLPQGKGLVGLVAQSRHPINTDNAQQHSAYLYLAETHEERFQSFCGVPLVRRGRVIGVLVVQGRQSRQISQQEEAFLVTLASQLSLLLDGVSVAIAQPRNSNVRRTGVKGSSGVGIGSVLLCGGTELYGVADCPCADSELTIERWHQLLAQVRSDIETQQRTLDPEFSSSIAAVFEAYQLLLSDKALIDSVEQQIRQGHDLPSALKRSIQQLSDLFLSMDDPYLRARHEDIQHLGNKLYSAWLGEDLRNTTVDGPVVLVGAQVGIAEIAQVPAEQLMGIICYEGSSLSHTAVVAKAMGIPAVLGVGALRGINGGETIIVDGNQGQVILRPSASLVAEFGKLVNDDNELLSQLANLRDLPAQTTDGEVIRLFTNTGLLADIAPGVRHGAEGVGLYRTEIPFMVYDNFPSEDEQVSTYRKILDAYPDKPVCMRTLDIGGDKQLPYFPIANEENPALGWRGIRFCLDNVQLLMTQVRAMLRAAQGKNNLRILLPMVSASEELDSFRELLLDACQQLWQEGYQVSQPRLGVMVEVPATISQLERWSTQIDFVSIGSNDLSQYLLALDRNNARVAQRYDPVHPSVLAEIKRVVDIAQRCDLPLSVCGEMASDPVAVVLLLGMGVKTLSLSAPRLPRIKCLLRSLSAADAQTLWYEIAELDRAQQIRNRVGDFLRGKGLEALCR